MGWWFHKNNSALSFCCIALLTAFSIHAEKPTLLDGYYPAYPPLHIAPNQDEARVKRGEYLSKMGDCIACHTNVQGGTPAFAGGLPIATPFGTFYSPNITPDKETGIGNWSEADFVRALKQGIGPGGKHYFPVFPYVYYANLPDEDVRDLYAFFQSIPAVHQVNRSLPFPFSIPGARYSLLGWKLLFFYPNTPLTYDATRSKTWNRGKYIVDGLGHCSMCHSPLNPLGGVKKKYYLTGGFIDGYWAPNISKLGLESATVEEVANVFASGELLHKAGPVAGPMADVNHNSLYYLTPEDHLAIATYLKTVESQEQIVIPPSNEAPNLRRGKQVYLQSCILCHQNGQMSAPLIGDSSNWYHRLKSSGLNGFYRHVINGYNSMPIKGACVMCSDNDIISACDYILNASLTRSQRTLLAEGGGHAFSASGRNVYHENCSVCHDEGKLGAPKIGDKIIWKPLLAQNLDVLVEHTLNGAGHPKNGGCPHCTTKEIIEAIKYMAEQSSDDGHYSLW